MKKIYKHKGYYNGIDAVINCDLPAQAIINNINNGKGEFFTYDDEDEETDEEQYLLEHGGRLDGNFIIVDSVSEKCKDTPFDLLMAQDLSDEYVEVWEFSHTENY